MRLVPLCADDRSWDGLKVQWKAEAENIGEDFSTFVIGTFGPLEKFAMQEASKAGLYGLYDGKTYPAVCQTTRLLIRNYASPVLRTRFVSVSPKHAVGDVDEYGKVIVALFSGVIWLSREELPADHIHFQLRSPSDAQFLAHLQAVRPTSLFKGFQIRGARVECTVKM